MTKESSNSAKKVGKVTCGVVGAVAGLAVAGPGGAAAGIITGVTLGGLIDGKMSDNADEE